jgi:hypothetical protein
VAHNAGRCVSWGNRILARPSYCRAGTAAETPGKARQGRHRGELAALLILAITPRAQISDLITQIDKLVGIAKEPSGLLRPRCGRF